MKIFKRGQVGLPTCPDARVDVYETNTGLRILIGKEGDDKIKRWHLSISHKDRLPTWDEIKQARYDLLPRSRDFAMILPGDDKPYVDLHPYCLHIWQIVGDELKQAIDTY